MTSRNLSPQWLKFLKSLGIEFWLPLPLLGLSFWFIGGWLTEHTLSRPSNNVAQLKTTQPNYGKKIALIKVEIDRQQGASLVTVKKTESKLSTTYTESRIVLKTTHIPTVETAISNELGITRKQLRKKLRYRWEE